MLGTSHCIFTDGKLKSVYNTWITRLIVYVRIVSIYIQ